MTARSDEVATTPVVSQLVERAMPSMSEAMRKIGMLLLSDPTAPLRGSITELADRAGASPATVTRFCRALGYSGFIQFRVAVATDLGRSPGVVHIGTAFHPRDEPNDILRTLVSGHVNSLHGTAAGLDVADCVKVAQAVARSRQVLLYGAAGSGVVATEMEHRMYRIGVNVHAWLDVHTALASASMLTRSDVAICISHSGETKETVEVLERSRAAGAMTVAVTSVHRSTIQRFADITLMAAVPNQYLHPADMSPKHAQLLVLDFLYMLLVQEDYEGAVAKLDVSAASVAEHKHGKGFTPISSNPTTQEVSA